MYPAANRPDTCPNSCDGDRPNLDTPVIETIRLETSTTHGCFGVIRIGGSLVGLFTLEPPVFGNLPNISAINPGMYQCIRHVSPKYGKTYLVTGVPGRSEILYPHPGNTVKNTEGCTLMGTAVGTLQGYKAVQNSTMACTRFLAMMEKHDRFTLIIKEMF